MMCNPKHCKKCGMWWKLDGTDDTGKLKSTEGCGYMLTYLKLDMVHRAINGVRIDTQDQRNQGVKGLMSLGEALRKRQQKEIEL